MQLPIYDFETSRNHFSYEFVSVGPKGLITKRVQFTLIHPSGMYNLAFGDVDPAKDTLDDQAISNNGDWEKALATVVATAHDFCRNHHRASIFVVGGTPARTRFYQMGIAKYIDRIQTQFDIYGELGEEWEPFQRGRAYYTAFVAYPLITSSYHA